MEKIKIPIILGPTSSGKTSLALELCKKTDAVIVAADSRQVFKFMDIGTGKIPVESDLKITKKDDAWILNNVEIYGYDLATPDQYFSGYDYAKLMLTKISALLTEGKKVVIVGGTGFYIDLLTGRQKLNSTSPDFDLRAQLESQDLETLLLKLKDIDPVEFEKIDKRNKVRIQRAVEKNLSQNTNDQLPYLQNVEFIFFGLEAPRDFLYQKVDKWLETVWENGLLEETEFLRKKYSGSLKLQGLVYKSVVDHLTKQKDKPTAIQEAKWALHAYIRRQQTWFKKNKEIVWFDVSTDSREQVIDDIIKKTWTKK